MISRLANRNTTDVPMTTPASTLGWATSRLNEPTALPVRADSTEVRKEPNSAVAASTAVAIAMPLVIALVVLTIASRWVRATAASPSTVPGHLRDALRVVDHRAEGVHGHDHSTLPMVDQAT
jgi:hypothetical protein